MTKIKYVPRRPLAVICLLLIVGVLLYAFIDGDQGYLAGSLKVSVKGQIVKKETKNQKQIIYLKNISFIQPADSARDFQNKVNGIVCYLGEEQIVPDMGAFVLVEGEIESFKKATNPGEFDLYNYYKSIGYQRVIYKTKIIKNEKPTNSWREELYQLKEHLGSVYDRICDAEDAGILRTMLLGDRSLLDSDIKKLYQQNGIAHILSISGLHISLLGMGLYRILKKLVPGKIVSSVISAVFLLLYACMTGASTGTIRAVVMFILLMGAFVFLRSYDLLTALALAAFIMIFNNPYIVLNTGFWMSFLAVFGIAVFSKIFHISLDDRYKYINKVVAALIASASVSFFTLPLILLSYYEYPTYSVFLNLIIVPIIGLLLGTALLALFVGCISINAGIAIGYICHYMLQFIKLVCQFFDGLPFSTLTFGKPELACVFIFYILLISLMLLDYYFKYYKENALPIYAKLIVILISFGLLLPIRPAFSLYMLDVGQGDGLCILNGNNVIMIDGGTSSKNDIGKYILTPFLKSTGHKKVDYWLLSHPDKDHYSGLVEMIDEGEIDIKRVIVPRTENIFLDGEELITLLTKRNVQVLYGAYGDRLNFGKLDMFFLGPDENASYEDSNDYSEVIVAEYSGKRFLFTGDASLKSEGLYANRVGKVNLLKVAHHGSTTSTGPQLVKQIKPEYALISVGKNNSYGHPHQEVLERLCNSGVKILRTDENGAILVKVKNGDLVFKTYG